MRLTSSSRAIEGFESEFGTESTRRRRSASGESKKKSTRPRVVLLRNLSREMPSVEMRRTTRVFGMGKGVDGARVLRSGRRLWPESSVVKLERTNEDEDWLKLLKNNGESRDSDAIGMKQQRGWTRATRPAGPKPKQKKSSLLRVFQEHQVKSPLLDSKPVMRKRRSFKRQPSQCGRGKQPSFLQGTRAVHLWSL